MMEDSPLAGTLSALSRFFIGRGSLEETLHWVVELTTVAIPPAELVGITMPTENGPRTAVFTDPLSPEVDQTQYDTGTGPCLDAMRDHTVRYLESTRESGPWPEFRTAARERGILSTVSLPLVSDDRMVGAMNLYSHVERGFSDADRAIATEIAGQAAVLLANSRLYWDAQQLSDRLGEAMKTRAVIEQAKGVLMGAERCTPEEAFDLLRRASQRENVKLRDIAQRIVDRTSRPDLDGSEPPATRPPRV